MTEIEPTWWTHRRVDDDEHPWRASAVYATNDSRGISARAEWSLLRRGFGWGFQLGRNGDESDIGLDLHAGRLGSVWLRLRSPWTKWANIERQGDDDREWYKARHYGICLFPFDGCWFRFQWDARDGEWSRGQPWYREITFGERHLWGLRSHDTVSEDQGECMIPMPEGQYRATWERVTTRRRFVRFPGTLRNRWQRPTSYYRLDIPGGIPHWGKGENSWDCGMDGLCGTSGRTLAEAIGNAIASSLRDRDRYGGPSDLPEPMTIGQAETWALSR